MGGRYLSHLQRYHLHSLCQVQLYIFPHYDLCNVVFLHVVLLFIDQNKCALQPHSQDVPIYLDPGQLVGMCLFQLISEEGGHATILCLSCFIREDSTGVLPSSCSWGESGLRPCASLDCPGNQFVCVGRGIFPPDEGQVTTLYKSQWEPCGQWGCACL